MNDLHSSASFSSATKSAVPLGFVSKGLQGLQPAYFALVMATGIVSIDCRLFGLAHLSQLLFGLNCFAYLVLWALYLIRVSVYTKSFVEDCFSHRRAFGFFTIVAATNVLGSQFLLLEANKALATALWWIALFLWFTCTYSIFIFLIISRRKPAIDEGVNGGWLIAVVATQSLCVLGSQLRIDLFGSIELTGLILLSFWLFGGMLYLWLISLIFYRYMFFKFEPSDLIPPYWINMGAMAISTVGGCELIMQFSTVHPIGAMLPFVEGVSVLYWATATWWIPMLLVLGVWRHGIHKLSFRYDPLYWGLVFPLGMYSVCTSKLSQVLSIPALVGIAQVFLVCAVLGWTITFLSMAERPLFALVLGIRAGKGFFKGGRNE